MNKENEEKIAEFWKHHNIYQKAKARGKKKFYFLDGPPYATGAIHMGTAWNKVLKDMYLRFFRMRGFSVWDQPGYDTHGLPIENKVEKELKLKTKTDIEKLGVEKFVERCRGFATKYIDVMNNQFEDLGVWMDWSSPYLTLNNDYIEGAWATFKIAYEKGFLFKDSYSVHVCPHCETAVAYNEVVYQKIADNSIYVKFPVKGNEFLVIWTTTPWTIPSNTGVMAKPDAEYVKVQVSNEVLIVAKEMLENLMTKFGIADYKILAVLKGKDLKGMTYRHPLEDVLPFQQDLKNGHRVVLSDQFVTLAEGTGLVHTAPGHGEEDYKVGKENGLPLLNPLALDGKFREGKYAGVAARDANKLIINDLKERGAIIHEEKVEHDYPMCWRCESHLLQMAVPQWFFRVTAIREKLIKENEKVSWQPEWAKKRFHNWLESLGDWPISRQRYWGIPLPIWVCKKCESVKVIGSSEELPVKLEDLHRPYIDGVLLDCKCGGKMERIKDVLDVWFDSGLAGWASLGYPKNKKLFQELWPCDFQTEGPDQIRGWWNSQLITSVITFDTAPFTNILFHGFVLDAHGIKMSKSKGNVVDPFDMVKKYSRDVLRYYLLSSSPWDDFYFNSKETDEIFKSFNVIDNTFNFVKMYANKAEKPKKLNAEDEWILSRVNSLVENSTKNTEAYNGHKAAEELYDFILNDLSRWYIKLVRDRVWPSYEGKDKDAAMHTLFEVSSTVTKLLAPVCPFLAESVYQNVLKPLGEKEESVHLCDWPKAEKKLIAKNLEDNMKIVKIIVETAGSLRAEAKIKSRWPLAEILVTGEKNKGAVESLGSVIKLMCNVKKVGYSDKEAKGFTAKEIDNGVVFLDTNLTGELREEAMLREVLRKVQDTRKKAGMVISDSISLKLEGCDELKKHENQMSREVGASSIVFGKASGEAIEFEGRKITIEIKKL